MPGRDLHRQPERTPSEKSRQADSLRPQPDHAPPSQTAAPLVGGMIQLQRQAGNRAVQRMIARTQQGTTPHEVAPEVAQGIAEARGGGQPLDGPLRAQLEPRFGVDFSGVRVHTDVRADTLSRAVAARAFTTGRDLFFRQGAYQPGSASGRELLAHELTHVVQQQGAPLQTKLAVSQPGDRFEQEADQVARAVMRDEQIVSHSAAPARTPVAQSGVQRQVARSIMRQVATEDQQHWMHAADWKMIDIEGPRVASRVYSPQEIALIAKCNTLQEIQQRVPDAQLPAGLLAKPFVKQKSGKGGGVLFKADFPDLMMFEQLLFQGNGLLRHEIFSYDQVEVRPKGRVRRGQPAPEPQKVLKPRAQPSRQVFFEKNGSEAHLAPIIRGKGKTRKEIPAEPIAPRKSVVDQFTREEQARSEAEVKSDQTEVVSGKRVADVWNLSNPDDFFQRKRFTDGAARQLRLAYRVVVDDFKNGRFQPSSKLEPFQQKQFNNVRAWIAGLIGMSRGWKQEGISSRPEDLMAREAVPAMCNVISYYLYGQLTGNIPKETSFGQHVVEEMRKGNIGSQIKETDAPDAITADTVKDIVEVGGAFYGFGSGDWRERFSADVLTAKVPITHPSRRKDFETFLNSGVRLAIVHQDTKGAGAPTHFHLIIKDKDNVWRNIDHTSDKFAQRGGPTNFNRVYGIVFDKAALETARAMFEQIEQQGAPVQVPSK